MLLMLMLASNMLNFEVELLIIDPDKRAAPDYFHFLAPQLNLFMTSREKQVTHIPTKD